MDDGRELDGRTDEDLNDVEMTEDDESQMDESSYSDFEEYSSSDESTDSEEETASNNVRLVLFALPIFCNSSFEFLQLGRLGTTGNKNRKRKFF